MTVDEAIALLLRGSGYTLRSKIVEQFINHLPQLMQK